MDALDGDVHRQYSGCPNKTWIISPTGRVVYKVEWTAARDICQALEELPRLDEMKQEGTVRQFYKESIAYRS